MNTLNGEQYLALVERCYQMALEPQLLPEFMLTLRDALGASNVTFGKYHYVDGAADVDVYCTLSFAEDWRNDVMARDYNDPSNNIGFKMLLTAAPGSVSCSEDFLSLRELKRQGFYQDICRPLGLGATTALTLTRGPVQGSGLFYQFGPEKLPDRNGDIAFARRIAPHLQRAAQIMELIGSKEATLVSLETLLAHQSFGVALIDDRGEVLFMNDVAQAQARAQEALMVRRRRLVATRRDLRDQFDTAVRAAVQTGIGRGTDPGVELLLPRPSNQRPLTCVISPLTSSEPLVPIRRPAAMVVIKDPTTVASSSVEQMARAYRLSAKQAAISALLLEGNSGEAIADRLQISRNTLKTHIRRLYEKLDCRNQAEFIRLFSGGFD